MKHLLTKREAAQFLRKPESWIAYAVSMRLLPHYKVGQQLRFEESELLGWLQRHRVRARYEAKPSGRDPRRG